VTKNIYTLNNKVLYQKNNLLKIKRILNTEIYIRKTQAVGSSAEALYNTWKSKSSSDCWLGNVHLLCKLKLQQLSLVLKTN